MVISFSYMANSVRSTARFNKTVIICLQVILSPYVEFGRSVMTNMSTCMGEYCGVR